MMASSDKAHQSFTASSGTGRTKPLGLPLTIVLAATLMGSPSISRAQTQGSTEIADGAHRGYVAVRLPGGAESAEYEVLDELNADRLFVPASVLKVFTVAAALEHLGAGYQWVTRLTSNGAMAGPVLEGDLVIEAGADPTWGDDFFDRGAGTPLAALANQVRARGLTRISGDLVVDASRFLGRLHPTDRTYGDLPYRYGTPPAALAVDDATIRVRVAPGASVGEPARVAAPDGLKLVNQTRTVGRARHGSGTLDFVPLWGMNTLLLRGEYPISEAPFVVSASDPSPELRVATVLKLLPGCHVGRARLSTRRVERLSRREGSHVPQQQDSFPAFEPEYQGILKLLTGNLIPALACHEIGKALDSPFHETGEMAGVGTWREQHPYRIAMGPKQETGDIFLESLGQRIRNTQRPVSGATWPSG